MKLYTEQELKKHLYNHSDEFFDQLTPIELPSDEEIEKEADEFNILRLKRRGNTLVHNDTFIYGAKWMKKQILKQTNSDERK